MISPSALGFQNVPSDPVSGRGIRAVRRAKARQREGQRYSPVGVIKPYSQDYWDGLSDQEKMLHVARNRRFDVVPELMALETRGYGDRIADRASRLLSADDPWVGSTLRRLSREALQKMPKDALLGLLASDEIPDGEVLHALRAWQQHYMDGQLDKELRRIPLEERTKWAPIVKGLGSDTYETYRRNKFLQSKLPKLEEEQIEVMVAAAGFGKLPEEWGERVFQSLMDNDITKQLIRISEAPARALDGLFRVTARITGLEVDENETAGRVAVRQFLGLDPDKAPGKQISGTLDAVKIFALDTFVIGGKALKPFKAGAQAKRITDVEAALRWTEQMGAKRLANWWTKLPASERTTGKLSRMGEVFGWQVNDRKFYARLAKARTPKEFRDGLKTSIEKVEVATLPVFPAYGKARMSLERAFDGRYNMMRHTWAGHIDPRTVHFEKHLRRFGDFMFDDVARTDQAMDPVLKAAGNSGGSRFYTMRALRKFTDDAIDTWAVRQGVAKEVIEKARKLLAREGRGGFWEQSDSLIGAADESAEIGQLYLSERAVRVPTYLDMADLERAVRYVAKDRKIKLPRGFHNTLRRVGQINYKLFVPLWLTNPRLGFKIALEETAFLAGDPVIGKRFRRALGQRFLDETVGHLPFLRDKHLFNAFEELAEEIPAAVLTAGVRSGYYRSTKGMAALPKELRKVMEDAGKEFGRVTGVRWGAITRENPSYSVGYYHVVNHQILQHPLGRLALQHADDANRVPVLRRWLTETDEGRMFLDAVPTPELAKVLPGKGAQQAAKAQQVAEEAVKFVDYYLPEQAGGLRELAKLGRVDLDDIDEYAKLGPRTVYGPMFESAGGDLLSAIPDRVWNFNARMIDFVRETGWRLGGQDELNRLARLKDTFERHGMAWPLSKTQEEARALKHATERMMRLENPLERTRFGEYMRNVLLFHDAQLNFLKRWGRLATQNPGYISRLAHMVPAGENLGLFQRDEQTGALSLTIPLSREYWKWLMTGGEDGPETKFMRHLVFSVGRNRRLQWGLDAILNAPFNIAGQSFVPEIVPFAFQNDVSFAPTITIPAQALLLFKLNDRELTRDLFGDYATFVDDEDSWTDVIANAAMAGWMRSMAGAIRGPDGDRATGSAFVDYMKWLSVQEDKDSLTDPKKRDAMIRAAKSNIQTLSLFSAASQAVLPWRMLPNPHTRDLFEEYQGLLDEHGYEDGVKRWLDKYGFQALPMTVARSVSVVESVTGEKRKRIVSMPPTEQAIAFLRSNPEFVNEFPDVAGVFMTFNEADFSLVAFGDQVAEGYRDSVEANHWLALVQASTANRIWYDEIEPELERLRQEAPDEAVRELSAELRQEVSTLFPLWEEVEGLKEDRSHFRQLAIEQLREAVDHPVVRDREDVAPVRDLILAYDQAKEFAQANGFRTLTGKTVSPIRLAFKDYYQALYTESGSEALRVAYELLFRFEMEQSYDQLLLEEAS